MQDPNGGAMDPRDSETLALMGAVAERAIGAPVPVREPVPVPVPAADPPTPPGAVDDLLGRARSGYASQNAVGGTRLRFVKRAALRGSRLFTHKLVESGQTVADAVQVLETTHGAAIAELVRRADQAEASRAAETARRDIDTQNLQMQIHRDADLLQAQITNAGNALNAQLTSIELGTADAVDGVSQELYRTTQTLAALEAAIRDLDSRFDRVTRIAEYDKSELYRIRALVARLAGTAVERTGSGELRPASAVDQVPGGSDPSPVTLDEDTYLDFEQGFRGTRDEIKSRQVDALPLIAHVQGSPAPVLDLGCGRGEWLEILGGEGITAYGVDSNAAMVADAVGSGLDARVGDALVHLEQLEESSLEAVSAFHFVEHIPLDALVALLDNSLLALRPGGTLLFETPNPTNLVVGAAAFYLDPTHLRPLHPDFLRFLVESRGFTDVTVHFVHPVIDEAALQSGGPANGYDDARLARVVRAAEWALFGPQDYVLVARRPEKTP